MNTQDLPRLPESSPILAQVPEGDAVLANVLARLRLGTSRRYPGEPVTHWEHALQTAALARQARASDALVTAALLHDIGHLEDEIVDTASSMQGLDDRHEERAVRLLSPWFGPEVVEPIRLHVQAKRYLVARADGYAAKLSVDSQRSLMLQGGPMTRAEGAAFEALPHAPEALRLRCWDDAAKDPDARVPDSDPFIGAVRRSLRPWRAGGHG